MSRVSQSRFKRYWRKAYPVVRNDIFAFAKLFGVEPTWQQADLFKAVQKHAGGRGKVAVKSGQGPGKTFGSALVALWRCLRYHNGLVVVTAPTARQCQDIFLHEVRQHMIRAPKWLQGMVEVTNTRVKILGSNDWGIQCVTSNKVENAQGFHRPKGLTVIYEEASGIPHEIVRQFQGTQTGEDTLHLMIGNPTTRVSPLYDCFYKNPDQWDLMTFNSEESPIVSQQNVKDMAEEFGKDSDVYRVRVLGEFPLTDPKCVISDADCWAATAKKMDALQHHSLGGEKAHQQIGIDYARYGADESVVYIRKGGIVKASKVFAHSEPAHVTAWAFGEQERLGWSNKDTLYIPDAGGMGQGVLHMYPSSGRRKDEFHNGGRPKDPRKYKNRMTEAHFEVAKLIKKQRICIPDDTALIFQLSSRHYAMNLKGQLVLETKEQYTRRTGFPSPDKADAFIMAFSPTHVTRLRMSKGGR